NCNLPFKFIQYNSNFDFAILNFEYLDKLSKCHILDFCDKVDLYSELFMIGYGIIKFPSPTPDIILTNIINICDKHYGQHYVYNLTIEEGGLGFLLISKDGKLVGIYIHKINITDYVIFLYSNKELFNDLQNYK